MANKIDVGQDVIIARAIGKRNPDSVNRLFSRFLYYYGGDRSEVPLGTRGSVIELYNNDLEIRVHLTSGPAIGDSRWFHPDELKSLPIPKRIREIQLEPHPLLEISSQTPMIVADDSVFSLEEQKGKRTLTEIATLSSLDEMFFSRNQAKIEEVSLDYVNYFLNISSVNSDKDLPKMIFSQIFPYLRGEGYEKKIAGEIGKTQTQTSQTPATEEKPAQAEKLLPRTLYEKINKMEEELSGIKNQIQDFPFEEEKREGRLESIMNYLSKIFRKNEKRSRKQEKLDLLLSEEGIPEYKVRGETYQGSSLLSQAVGERAYILNNSHVQSLVPSKKGDITLNGKRYHLGERRSFDLSQRRYQDLLARKIVLDTINARLSRPQLQDLLIREDGEAAAFAGMENYEEGDFGFLKNNGNYFVYLKAPEFAIKSPEDGNYYLFGESKIGFKVAQNSGRLACSAPLMVKGNGNPFEYGGDFSSFCIGGNRLPEDGNDTGDVIAKQLRTLRNIMIFGYYGSVGPFRRLLPGSYSPHIIKNFDELKARGVLISDGTRNGRYIYYQKKEKK